MDLEKSGYTKDELQLLQVDQLKGWLDSRKIFYLKSIKKDDMIDIILKRQYQKEICDDMSKVTREYHVGTVNYALPVYLIIKIFRLVWDELLDKSLSVDTSLEPIYKIDTRYRMALYLASVNKQLFNVVSQFPSVCMSLTSVQFTHMATEPWCVVKRPDRLEMGHHAIDNLFHTEPALHHLLIESVSKVTKLKISYSHDKPTIRQRSLEQMCTAMCNIVSLVIGGGIGGAIQLDVIHFEVLAKSLPTLVKCDFEKLNMNTESQKGIQTFFNNVKQTMVKIKLPPKFNIDNEKVRDSLSTLGVDLIRQPYTNLTKFICYDFEFPTHATIFNQKNRLQRVSFYQGITYLQVSVNQLNMRLGWTTVINDLFPNLTTLYNDYRHSQLNLDLANMITNPKFSCYITCLFIQVKTNHQQVVPTTIVELPTNPPLPLPPLPTASKFKYLKEKWNCLVY
ncbi:hypothetical protein DFA_06902 [Cavenderia fasciculata]|uniref:Uncharacterized protein n=1 Tax=Cavenderia fasciculata TaxID=261658 RepID=F4PWZ7_CACFS|nr:uncharacterized protein DFA_06902 [Cavenderia fasciculata]EGG19800.1 hypothetical protein DFA_06902 [Cavenderia fasciculata]|eukprot:XP_004358146.1 hypothetical protein DFA_06902 [Cavenderia fasciculata]